MAVVGHEREEPEAWMEVQAVSGDHDAEAGLDRLRASYDEVPYESYGHPPRLRVNWPRSHGFSGSRPLMSRVRECSKSAARPQAT